MFNTRKCVKSGPFLNSSSATPKLIALSIFIIAFVAYVVVGAGISTAAEPVSKGQALAMRYCSDCHEVAANMASFKKVKDAPSFVTIANDPKKSSESHLMGVLSRARQSSLYGSTHSLMHVKAGGYLDDDQVHSLIDYIQSLKQNK
jgi:mono/diheme cytochrome c family protein